MGRTSDARERLVDSAKELIAGRSYGAVGVGDLCARAGVKKGSFYYFFDSKLDLALEAIDSHWEEISAQMLEGIEPPVTGPDLLLAYLMNLYQGQRQIFDETGVVQGCPFGNLAVEQSTQEEAIRQRICATFQKLSDHLATMIEDSMERGEVPPGDPSIVADQIIAFMQGVMMMAKTRNDPEVLRKLGRGAFKILGAEPTLAARQAVAEA